MNKSDFAILLSKKHEFFDKDDIEISIKLIIEYLSSSLAKRERIEIRGFGSFSVRSRKKRIGRNPKTGKSISVSTKYHPYFRASKSLRNAINN